MSLDRRDFLKLSGLAAASVGFPNLCKLPNFPSVKTFSDGSVFGGLYWKPCVEGKWNLPKRTEEGTAIFIEKENLIVIANDNEWYKVVSGGINAV